MNLGFWKQLNEKAIARGTPIMALAPMANVTDVAFREIIMKYSKPDVLWTEFVSADGLCSKAGRPMLLRDLEFTPNQHPIVAQLFTSHPEKIREAAELVQSLGFDGLDINMGCPDKTIEKQGAGAAMMKNPKLAREIIRSAMLGAPNIPVSVKTRIGYNKVELETWLPEILAERPAVVTIHARTRKEMSDVPARWEFVKMAVEICDEIQKDLPEGERTLIFGNGDLESVDDAVARCVAAGADGAMLGRAIFGNPWLFRENFDAKKESDVSITERLKVMLEHSELFMKKLGDIKNFVIMKKHYKAYVSGWDGAKELRVKLMETKDLEEVKTIVNEYIAKI